MSRSVITKAYMCMLVCALILKFALNIHRINRNCTHTHTHTQIKLQHLVSACSLIVFALHCKIVNLPAAATASLSAH